MRVVPESTRRFRERSLTRSGQALAPANDLSVKTEVSLA
jgi:hypothetical protein